jgi:hypothetical protein
LREACHALRADFSEALKVDHAVFTAAFTALNVLVLYACCNAVARAAYAAFAAAVYVVIAASMEVSRALTAVPTQEIFAATVEVVCANAIGTSAITPAAAIDRAIIFLFMLFF